MPSAFTHAFVGAAAAQLIPSGVPRVRAATVLAVISALPDLDILAFKLGIPYAHPLGHRGFSHSLLFACLVGALSVLMVPREAWSHRRTLLATFVIGAIVVASHGILDATTDAGLGIAFFCPFSEARFFLPFRPIETAAVDPLKFFSLRGLEVLWSEMRWVWAPILAVSAFGQTSRRLISRRGRRTGGSGL